MGGGAQHAAAMSTMPPGMCAVFKNLDPDENEASEIDASNKAREEVIGKLRALNLNVDQFMSSDKKYIFVVIGAPETMLKYEAEAQRAKIRLTEEFGGAMCYYSQELDEKKAYDKPMDGFDLFCSAVQLKLIDEVVRSKPYGDDEKQEPIDFDELILEEKVGRSPTPKHFPEPFLLHGMVGTSSLGNGTLFFPGRSGPQDLETGSEISTGVLCVTEAPNPRLCPPRP